MSKKNKSMFKIQDIIQSVDEISMKEVITLDQIIELDGGLNNRELYLGDLVENVGTVIDTCIRFWNRQDEEAGIPVEKRQPIKLYINSTGGFIVEAYTIINAIELSKTPVWTIATGAAYSGGFFIFIAGHKRFAYRLASFLFHEGSAGNAGDAGKFRNFAAFYEKTLNQLREITLKYTNITPEEYEKHIKDDWWFTAEEAVANGIADEISTELI